MAISSTQQVHNSALHSLKNFMKKLVSCGGRNKEPEELQSSPRAEKASRPPLASPTALQIAIRGIQYSDAPRPSSQMQFSTDPVVENVTDIAADEYLKSVNGIKTYLATQKLEQNPFPAKYLEWSQADLSISGYQTLSDADRIIAYGQAITNAKYAIALGMKAGATQLHKLYREGLQGLSDSSQNIEPNTRENQFYLKLSNTRIEHVDHISMQSPHSPDGVVKAVANALHLSSEIHKKDAELPKALADTYLGIFERTRMQKIIPCELYEAHTQASQRRSILGGHL